MFLEIKPEEIESKKKKKIRQEKKKEKKCYDWMSFTFDVFLFKCYTQKNLFDNPLTMCFQK